MNNCFVKWCYYVKFLVNQKKQYHPIAFLTIRRKKEENVFTLTALFYSSRLRYIVRRKK